MMKRLSKAAYVVLTVAACTPAAAATVPPADAFPTRPVRFLIGAAPDLLPRLMAQKLGESWKQQVVVDQRPAAGGIIAGETAARAPADGYTWIMSTASFVILDLLQPKLTYHFSRDFRPVALMATLPWVVVVHPSVPAKTLREFVQLARAQPGKLNYANPGTGTSTHLVTEIFKNAAKIDVVNVAYKERRGRDGRRPRGSGADDVRHRAGRSAVHEGRTAARARDHEQQALGRAARRADAGRIGFHRDRHGGMERRDVPVNTPRALVQKLNTELNRLLQTPAMKQQLISAGFEPAQTSVEEFDAFVKKGASNATAGSSAKRTSGSIEHS